jgi:hypothetical protein
VRVLLLGGLREGGRGGARGDVQARAGLRGHGGDGERAADGLILPIHTIYSRTNRSARGESLREMRVAMSSWLDSAHKMMVSNSIRIKRTQRRARPASENTTRNSVLLSVLSRRLFYWHHTQSVKK